MNPAEFLQRLRAALPPDNLLTVAEDIAPYECDGLTQYRETPLAVALPESEAQVVAILRACREHGVPLVPRGAGTGISGGATPLARGILLSTAKMRQVTEIDPLTRTARVQPGVTNLSISDRVAPLGLFYAPDPSSQIACTIGGNVAENSGGVHCLKYGLTTHNIIRVRGFSVNAMAVEFGSEALDAPGLDLLPLIVGSEGMLAIIT